VCKSKCGVDSRLIDRVLGRAYSVGFAMLRSP
jgi:hypothetical protein